MRFFFIVRCRTCIFVSLRLRGAIRGILRSVAVGAIFYAFYGEFGNRLRKARAVLTILNNALARCCYAKIFVRLNTVTKGLRI